MSRNIDALIAEHVFGWQISYGPESKYGDYVGNSKNGFRDRETVPNFSKSIADAWLVRDEMAEKIFSKRNSFTDACRRLVGEASGCTAINHSEVILRITPEIICKAALSALGVDYERE